MGIDYTTQNALRGAANAPQVAAGTSFNTTTGQAGSGATRDQQIQNANNEGFNGAPQPTTLTTPGSTPPVTPTTQPSGTNVNAAAGLPGNTTSANSNLTSNPNDAAGAFGPNLTPGVAPGSSAAAQGFANAKASGTNPPQAGGATGNTQPYTPQAEPDTTAVTNALANDKGYQAYLKDQADWQSSVQQEKTLSQQYDDLESKYNVPALNTQLMNMKNVIDGTQDDIRNEITAANGFASNSQVLAMTDARNKTLIQNYNQLLATKNNADQQVNTLIGLAKDDQQTARDNINEQLNIDSKIADYADKFSNNAQEGFKTVISAVGISGLYHGLINSDPSGGALKYAADVLHLTPDEFKYAAQNDTSQESKNLDIQDKELNIKKTQQDLNDNAGVPNSAKAGQVGYSDNGTKYNNQNAAQEITSSWNSQKAFDLKTGYIPPAQYNQAKGWWVSEGLSGNNFDDEFGQYKDPNQEKSGQKLYN